MTVPTIELDAKPQHRSFRLTRPGAAVETAVRPALALPEQEGRALLEEAARADVSRGGCWSAGPAGVQLWSGPWVDGRRGGTEHLGSVDWSWDTPVRHYITVYRVLVTASGAAAGLDAERLLSQVLALGGITPDTGAPVPTGVPAPRDPFRSRRRW